MNLSCLSMVSELRRKPIKHIWEFSGIVHFFVAGHTF